jgi:predicted secreted protein
MATTATSSQTATLAIKSGTTFVTIAQIETITGPGTTVDLIDITNLDSTGGYKEFFGGLKDNDAVSFDLIWNAADTGTGYFVTANTNASKENWKITFPFSTPKTATFDGYAIKWAPKAAKGDVMRSSGEIKPTGVITWA